MSFLEIDDIAKSYGKVEALKGFGLRLDQGDILSVLGPSGSGKSTLLRVLAGFEIPSEGRISLAGKTIVDDHHFLAPEKREIGLLFQSYALFPHFTVEENIAFGLHSWKGKEKANRIDEMLDLTSIGELRKRYPNALSGGQQQRVALARALAPKPSLLLMDEPFSNLDEALKQGLRHKLKRILKQSNTTTVMVSHDMRDALVMADKLCILDQGRKLQSDLIGEVQKKPVSAKVAEHFGPIMLLPESWKQHFALPTEGQHYCWIQQLKIGENQGIKAKVVATTEWMGRWSTLLETEDGAQVEVRASQAYKEGMTVFLELDKSAIHTEKLGS